MRQDMIEYVLGLISLYFLTYLLITHLEETWTEPNPSKFPMVSILIPAYNEEDTIGKTIESALDLDYPDYEAIVIDDGSTDKTYEIAKQYKINVIQQRNAGKAAALNNGITHAHGTYIATLDADSYVDRNALKDMVGYLENEKVAAVTPTMKIWKPKSILEKMQNSEYMLSNLLSKIFSLLDSITITPGPFSVYRKEVIEKLGGFDGSAMTEDNEMALKIQNNEYEIRTSKTAIVYTKVPKTIAKLFNQRKRWYAGYMHNIIKYRNLFRPKYGELGVFILPITITLLVLSLIKIILDTGSGIQSLNTRVPVDMLIGPAYVYAIAGIVMVLLLFFISIRESKERPTVSAFVFLGMMGALIPIMYIYTFFRRIYEIVVGGSAKW